MFSTTLDKDMSLNPLPGFAQSSGPTPAIPWNIKARTIDNLDHCPSFVLDNVVAILNNPLIVFAASGVIYMTGAANHRYCASAHIDTYLDIRAYY